VSNIRALLIAVTDRTTVEFVGYAARAASARQAPDFTLVLYIIKSLLLLLGPSFFAASIYMVLGRIIRLTGRRTPFDDQTLLVDEDRRRRRCPVLFCAVRW
jgi:hypothetical protein